MFDAKGTAAAIARELRAAGTPERAAQEKRYLKSELQHFGVTMPVLHRVAKEARRARPDLAHDDLIALVEELWRRPVHELRATAVDLLDLYARRLEAGDLTLLERMLRESRTWALVDSLAASVVGPLVERFPALARDLDRWAKDQDFWIRRSAMLALLGPLRRGAGDFARFARYADAMLEEKEFFIRKAIGWILRETSKQRPELVWSWLEPRAARASGLTVREASKYLPETQRQRLTSQRKKASASLRHSLRPRQGL